MEKIPSFAFQPPRWFALSRLAVAFPLLIFLISNSVKATSAQTPIPEFTVENTVYRGQDQILNQSLTLYTPGKAYDFLESPREITIIDFSRKRVIALNPTLAQQTDVSFEAILLFLDRIRTRAAEHPDATFRFAANPQFETKHLPSEQKWIFASRWITYKVQTRADVAPEICARYWEVANWIARANTLLVRGSPPPFARLVVNEALAARSEFPQEVVLLLPARNFLEWLPGRQPQLRSTHTLRLTIEPADRARIEQAEQWTSMFRRVDLAEYQEGLASVR